ncbi:hypothetical protein GCM10027049_03520 [Mucilaginibacter puniceus]
MKHIIFILAIAVIITSCNATGDKSEAALSDTLTAAPAPRTPNAQALCFLRTEGNNNQDTTSIELVIKNNKVTGIMNWMPYQKDNRMGKLQGDIKNDTIEVVWTFIQEGMTDTLNLQFKLDNNHLLQKPLKLNEKTGRQQTDKSADYTLAYNTSDKVYK